MRKQQPMLMWNPITQRVYIVTSYKDEGNGVFTARKKHDVTEQFDALASARRGECEQVITDCDDGLMPPFTAHCSTCGAEWGFTPKFCHNCGAKVTGTRDERKAVKQ